MVNKDGKNIIFFYYILIWKCVRGMTKDNGKIYLGRD